MLGSPAGPGGPSQRGLWPLAPATCPSTNGFAADSFGKCGVYSLFPGGPSFGSALYSHARTIGYTSGHIQQSSGNPFYHKDSLFTSAGYTFGAPTPPPGSPYSPVQLELLTKGFNSNIIIQQQPEYPPSPKKLQIQEKRCDEKCCALKTQKTCDCQSNNLSPVVVKKFSDNSPNGCSRTNPIEWCGVNVKKEPFATPCQVAEITTSVSPVVKVEVTSPKNSEHLISNSTVNDVGNIPVGIAVARQKFHHQEVVGSPSLPPAGLLTTVNAAAAAQVKEVTRASEIDTTAGMAAATAGGGVGNATLLQCTDERNTTLAGWSMGGTHNSALATPTLWQYPAPVPMEPMVPLPVPMPPVGFQLVRDPTTGGLLLLPTTGIEPIQQAVVWPSYHQPPSVLLPPIPPPPLQLLSSASSDYLTSSTTLHQHTQTHSTRLVAVTTDSKRKIPLPIPATTLIKIETDAATTLDQTKTLQAVSTIASNTGTVFTDQSMTPLVTTHVIYQHPTNLILSQPPASETVCRSQATSPVTCLTPPPEVTPLREEEPLTVQDASNQTETPICSEDDNTLQTIPDDKVQPKETEERASITPVPEETEQIKEDLLPPTPPQTQKEENGSNTDNKPEEDSNETLKPPDISGLELLSNSIVEFENGRKETENTPKRVEDTNLGGLDLLCALAEQRIREESVERKERKKEKRKLKKHSDEPKQKKSKNEEEPENKDARLESDMIRTYKTPESEIEVKKFIASKTQTSPNKEDDWPTMNEMELDMRIQLADLQRQYREKQKELKKLKPKKHSQKPPKKKPDRTSTPPPPLLDKQVETVPPPVPVKNPDLLKPPTLCAEKRLEPIKQSDRIINDYKNDLLRQQQQKALEELESSPEKNSSSKKRKVGRPKKLLSPSGFHVTTETIVAKKPKNNFVGYLLAAKEKLQLQSKLASSSPPRYVEDTVITHKMKKNKNNNNIIVEEVKSCKIRPKLKAEPTVKTYNDEEENHEWESSDETELVEPSPPTPQPVPPVVVPEPEPVKEVEEVKPVVDDRCILTAEHLAVDKLRVLTAMGGLFYAGHLNAVEPPDVYSITLDGERGNRPHIMSREEILRDAIVEIAPKNTQELITGTRLCAYWSQQYRCLYPGSVAEPGTPDPILDSKFVAVEFDDGDSGRIALEDIRLLPPDYPIIEYDPNPLLSLSKRRRRVSTCVPTEERRQVIPPVPQQPPPPPKTPPDLELEKENKDNNKPDTEAHKERKRLKKKKRDKLKQKLLHENKKKKRKHKCTDEYCKHKKHHKKHKKHKKHHHYNEEGLGVQTSDSFENEEDYDEFNDEETRDSSSVTNVEDEVTMDDIIKANNSKKSKKMRDRQESCESRSKMSAFLPARQLWSWSGKGYKRPRAKGRSRKQFYRTIQRGKETITVGDSAVFLSTGRPDRPYIGKIEAMWETCGTMVVRVKWFYHPEETVGCPSNLKYPGALFESQHVDENDVQTISHKCEVLPLKQYTARLGDDPQRYATIYDNNDIYYLAGNYCPTKEELQMEPDIPFAKPD